MPQSYLCSKKERGKKGANKSKEMQLGENMEMQATVGEAVMVLSKQLELLLNIFT